MTSVPILTYHANGIDGTDRHNNDHVALAEDLKLITEAGYQIINMDQLMAWRRGEVDDSTVEKAVVLTCDDGSAFDFHDIDHPKYGVLTSFFNILKNHQHETGQYVHMTNFVIVSPEARTTLDQLCLVGQGWWGDEWWQAAQDSGLMHIANHSWDHNHAAFDNPNKADDSFHHVNNKVLCDQQLGYSQQHLQKHFSVGYKNTYFAYPYGNYSDYLRYEYLPQYSPELGLEAAFTTEPKHVDQHSQTWAMPRYVCNNDWYDASGLQQILDQKKG